MLVTEDDEVCSHPLNQRLGEPAVSVPIKKRPVLPSSLPSGTPFKPCVLSLGSSFGNESFFRLGKSDANANATTKGKGIISSQDQNTQRFATCDVQLASLQNNKINKVGQGLSGGIRLAGPHMAFPPTGDPKASSNSSFGKGKAPGLDLNVRLDMVDSSDDSFMKHGGSSKLCHVTSQDQAAEARLLAPTPTIGRGVFKNQAAVASTATISSGACVNSNSSLNFSNAAGLSDKHGMADIALDLQLKPPSRPEIGINWKGLAPAPELSLSLFGKCTDEPPVAPSPPSAVIKPEPVVEGSKANNEEVPKLACEKSPVENIVKHEPCTASDHRISSSVVSGNNELTKRDQHEEPSQQTIQKDVGNVEQESSRLVGFDLNSEISPDDNKICDRPDVPAGPTDSSTISTEKLGEVASPKTKSIAHEPQKSVKCEENDSTNTSPLVATAKNQPSPSIANPLPSVSKTPSPDVVSCEAANQPSISTPKLEVSNPDESDSHCKPTEQSCVSIPEIAACKPHDALQCSSSLPESLVCHPWDCVVSDGLSQGSTEMDCSDDNRNHVSQLCDADKPYVDSSGNTEDDKKTNTLYIEVQKKHCGEVCVNTKSEDQQLATSDEISLLNTLDNAVSDGKVAIGCSSTDLQRWSTLEGSNSAPKIEISSQPCKTLDNRVENTSPDIKSKMSQSPNGKQVVATTSEHGTESHEGSKESNLPPRVAVLAKEPADGASSSHMDSQHANVMSASDRSEHEESKTNAFSTFSLENESERHADGWPLRDAGHAYVNRNERWDGRFLKSEQDKNNGEYQGGRHVSNTMNPRRPYYHYHGRGTGPYGHPRNFRGPPRMGNEAEIAFADDPTIGRRRPIDDELAYLPRFSWRRHSPPPNNRVPDRFHRREIPDIRFLEHEHFGDPDNIMEERFFAAHPHQHYVHGDNSRSRAQLRGVPLHFHRGRSPEVLGGNCEVMRRSPLSMQSPHRRHVNGRHHRSPFDQRVMQRNMGRFGIMGSQEAVEGDDFELPLHPAQLAELHEEEMLPYPVEGETYFDHAGSPREVDGRLRNRFGNKPRRRDVGEWEQEGGHRRHAPPHGWRDGNSNGDRPKRRRY